MFAKHILKTVGSWNRILPDRECPQSRQFPDRECPQGSRRECPPESSFSPVLQLAYDIKVHRHNVYQAHALGVG